VPAVFFPMGWKDLCLWRWEAEMETKRWMNENTFRKKESFEI